MIPKELKDDLTRRNLKPPAGAFTLQDICASVDNMTVSTAHKLMQEKVKSGEYKTGVFVHGRHSKRFYWIH